MGTADKKVFVCDISSLSCKKRTQSSAKDGSHNAVFAAINENIMTTLNNKCLLYKYNAHHLDVYLKGSHIIIYISPY